MLTERVNALREVIQARDAEERAQIENDSLREILHGANAQNQRLVLKCARLEAELAQRSLWRGLRAWCVGVLHV